MEPAAHRTHEGPGVARRAAHHERQRAERAAEEADDDAPLAEEGAEAWVPASEVRAALPEVGDNYHALPPAEKAATYSAKCGSVIHGGRVASSGMVERKL